MNGKRELQALALAAITTLGLTLPAVAAAHERHAGNRVEQRHSDYRARHHSQREQHNYKPRRHRGYNRHHYYGRPWWRHGRFDRHTLKRHYRHDHARRHYDDSRVRFSIDYYWYQ